MKSLLKSLLLAPSDKKYNYFRDSFFAVLSKRDKQFKEISEILFDIRVKSKGMLPTLSALKKILQDTEQSNLLNYLENIEQSPDYLIFNDDIEFFAHTQQVEKSCLEMDVMLQISNFNTAIKTNPVKDIASICAPMEELISGLHKAKNQVNRSESSTCGMLYGQEAIASLQQKYLEAAEKKKADEFTYYTLGIDKFNEVKMTKGDLVVIGGFTSHGKSLLLRNFIYDLLIKYRLNCYYVSMEMAFEKLQLLFLVLHANNREIFKTGLDISYAKVRDTELSPAEHDFLFNQVAHDLFTNPNYGTLFLEYPHKTKYRLSDMHSRIIELENTIMPIHAVAPDYLTMFYPLEGEVRRTPDRADYNQMIKEFKNMALSHRRPDGTPAPFLAISPAQISRGGLEVAVKNNNHYDLSALREYTELEASADVVFTVILTNEMRNSQEIQIQNLKNRDGKVETEPVKLTCELSKGFNIYEKREMATEVKTARLLTLF